MKKRLLQILPFLLTGLSVGIFYLAIILISPTRTQTPAAIEWSYFLHSWQVLLSAALLTLGVLLTFYLWSRTSSLLYRIGLVVCLCLLLGTAYLSMGKSVITSMFERLDGGRYLAAAQADHVADEEMVMGLTVGGKALAYPVKMVSYHHIVNERLAGEPFVVTY